MEKSLFHMSHRETLAHMGCTPREAKQNFGPALLSPFPRYLQDLWLEHTFRDAVMWALQFNFTELDRPRLAEQKGQMQCHRNGLK